MTSGPAERRAAPASTLRPTRLISFSGIDGAGKSTQIANLIARLEQAGLRVLLITFWDDVAALRQLREQTGHKVFKGDKGVGSPDAPIERRDKNVRSPVMTLFRLGIYFLDALSLRRVANRALASGSDVVIFDRYLFDELANLNLGNPAIRFYIRAIVRLIPQPRPALIIDADPVQARARKPEYPLDFLHLCRNSYLELSRILGCMTVIPPMPLEAAKREVVRQVLGDTARSDVAPHAVPAPTDFGLQKETDGQNARPLAF